MMQVYISYEEAALRFPKETQFIIESIRIRKKSKYKNADPNTLKWYMGYVELAPHISPSAPFERRANVYIAAQLGKRSCIEKAVKGIPQEFQEFYKEREALYVPDVGAEERYLKLEELWDQTLSIFSTMIQKTKGDDVPEWLESLKDKQQAPLKQKLVIGFTMRDLILSTIGGYILIALYFNSEVILSYLEGS